LKKEKIKISIILEDWMPTSPKRMKSDITPAIKEFQEDKDGVVLDMFLKHRDCDGEFTFDLFGRFRREFYKLHSREDGHINLLLRLKWLPALDYHPS
jgi:hypothetical protein